MPDHCTEEMLTYLDELRGSGITNMFGAASFLTASFPELTQSEAREVLKYWMESFAERHPNV